MMIEILVVAALGTKHSGGPEVPIIDQFQHRNFVKTKPSSREQTNYTIMQPGEKVFETPENKTDAEAAVPGKPSTDYEELRENDKPENGAQLQGSRAFCTSYITTRIIGITLCGAILAMAGSSLKGQQSPFIQTLGVILGAVAPPTILMVWFSEAVGRTSVDRGQVAIVFFTCVGLTMLWLLLFLIIFQSLLTLLNSSTSKALENPWYVTSTCLSPEPHTYNFSNIHLYCLRFTLAM